MGIEDVKILDFKNVEDVAGKQVELEMVDGNRIPFKIRRIFYSYASEPGTVRGAHANRNSEFVLISVSGTLKVKVDDGKQTAVYNLRNPSSGLYIPRMIWKEMYDFSKDNVLLVISSEHYEAGEYIRQRSDYLREMSNIKDRNNYMEEKL